MKTTYKIIAGLLIVAAAIVHLLNTGYRDWDSGGNTAYVLGLLFLFFWKERMEDERVRELKLKALTVAFAIGYAVTFGSKLALSFKGKGDIPRSLSAYDHVRDARRSARAFLLLALAGWADDQVGVGDRRLKGQKRTRRFGRVLEAGGLSERYFFRSATAACAAARRATGTR